MIKLKYVTQVGILEEKLKGIEEELLRREIKYEAITNRYKKELQT